jgi:hypothetical protein
MVFAQRDSETGASTLVRRHLIFEAVLQNPNPALGLAACRPVAQFWSSLSAVESMDERRGRLEKFFFEGLEPGGDTHLHAVGGRRVERQHPLLSAQRLQLCHDTANWNERKRAKLSFVGIFVRSYPLCLIEKIYAPL